jgi:hypothetical protein
MGELTSANTAPYLRTAPTTLSVDSPMRGEYSFNNSSSSRSDERRDSAYPINIRLAGRGG